MPVEENVNTIRVRVRDPKDFKDNSFRTIDIDKGKGIKSVIGKLKDSDKTSTQNFMFDKKKGWTKDKAVKWVKDHGHTPKEYDEIFIKNNSDELLKKEFSIEYKHEKAEDGSDYITGIANTKNKEDRHGDIPTNLDGKPVYGLKEFKKNPVALIDHLGSVGNILGSFVHIQETEKGLEFKLKLMKDPQTDIAKHAKAAYIEGHARAFSIGYKSPIYGDPKNPKRLTFMDIIEISAVAVGADPNALSNQPKPKTAVNVEDDNANVGRKLSPENRRQIMKLSRRFKQLKKLGKVK